MPQLEGAPARQSASDLAQVTSGLNLWLELEDPARMDELLLKLLEQQPVIRQALRNLNYVHFARFLPTPDLRALQVITEFDGDLNAYILDFALAIGDQFELILSYVQGWAPLHVKDHPAQFLDFILNRNLGYGKKSGGGVALFSAYPQRTVIDIVGASGVAPEAREPAPVAVERSDVQANILRGVGALHAWHAGVHFDSAASAQAFLRDILSGDHGTPRLSNGAEWPDKSKRPAYHLTIGFTYDGLQALGISAQDRQAFEEAHKAFVLGPGDTLLANRTGDVGDSRPAFWQLGGANALRMLLSLYADDKAELQNQSAALSARLAARGLQIVNRPWETDALLDDDHPDRHHVHFGYVDGLSQPRLAILDEPADPLDTQPRANVGEFLLGAAYPNLFGGANSLGGLSSGLAQNATFAALRIMEQDVVAFDQLLTDAAHQHGVGRDWIAARLMGRWPDGTPVSQSADQPLPEPSAPHRNRFDYLPSARHPSVPDDSAGLRCPMGAHARRMNPRSARVAGVAHSRRLIRRGMPYGPAYRSGAAPDGAKRGLFGLFICADLERQYEFLLHQWAQGDHTTSGLTGQQDPVIGAQATLQKGRPMTGQFRIPMAGGKPDIVLDVPRLVKTVGSAYLFMPGIRGVEHLAGQPAVQAESASAKELPQPGAIDPATFDPRSKAVRDDPFKAYAWFRKNQPVARLPLMDGTWVFDHHHVEEVARDNVRFRKRRSTAQRPAGLLNMDDPAHAGCRAAIEPLFNAVLPQVAPCLQAMVADTYARNCRNQGQAAPLDWITRFAQPVAQAAFFELFGLPLQAAESVVAQAERILALASPADDRRIELALDRMQQELAATLQALARQQIPGRLFGRVLQIPTHFDQASNVAVPPPPAEPRLSGLQVERLANSVTLAMAGFLPLQWFIALVTWRLLDQQGRLLQQLKDDPSISNRQVVDELLRFDMSTPMSARYAAHDGIVLNGQALRQDERVVIVWSSASRDDAFGTDPDSIDLKRGTGPGWAFGAQGEHNCLGRDMVYALMEPVIQTLRTATPTPVLAKDFAPAWGVPAEGAMFRAMAALMLHC